MSHSRWKRNFRLGEGSVYSGLAHSVCVRLMIGLGSIITCEPLIRPIARYREVMPTSSCCIERSVWFGVFRQSSEQENKPWEKSVMLTSPFTNAHRLHVKSLYRRMLNNSLNWTIRRDIWRQKAIEIRAEFERNRYYCKRTYAVYMESLMLCDIYL